MYTKQPCDSCNEPVDVDAEISWPRLLLILAFAGCFYYGLACLSMWIFLLPASLSFNVKCSRCKKSLFSVRFWNVTKLNPDAIIRVVANIKMPLLQFMYCFAYSLLCSALITGFVLLSQVPTKQLVPWSEFDKHIVQPSVQGDVFESNNYFQSHYKDRTFNWTGMAYTGSYIGDEVSSGINCRNISMPGLEYRSARLFVCYQTAEDTSECVIKPPASSKTFQVQIGGKMQEIGTKSNAIYIKCSQAWIRVINGTQAWCPPGA